MEEERLNNDKLYLALTRPAMVFGVPLEAAFISVFVGGLAMIIGDSIFYLVLAVPLIVISHFIVKRDQNAFRILFRFFDTGAKCRNRAHWGGSSPSPLRVRRTYNIEEID
ncbi:VirB3 family type IV secretion system protein [Phaeobacter sp. A90a-4k]|uniref:type IV secretion system protein VirB3 n=1 Tax=unclassified Phaeobacter TaxID=2621772 RepID=UPI003A846B64